MVVAVPSQCEEKQPQLPGNYPDSLTVTYLIQSAKVCGYDGIVNTGCVYESITRDTCEELQYFAHVG